MLVDAIRLPAPVERKEVIDQLLIRQFGPVYHAFESRNRIGRAPHADKLRDQQGFFRERAGQAEAGYNGTHRRVCLTVLRMQKSLDVQEKASPSDVR